MNRLKRLARARRRCRSMASIFSMLLPAALVSAQKIDIPVAGHSTVAEPAPSAIVADYVRAEKLKRADEWRARAHESVRKVEVDDDTTQTHQVIDLLLSSQSIHAPGRDFMKEYLDGLSDARVRRAFTELASGSRQSHGVLAARLRLAEAVLRRPTLAQHHVDAARERALARFLSASSLSEARAALADSPIVEWRRLPGIPEEPEEFAAADELMNHANRYGCRRHEAWLATGALSTERARLAAEGEPSEFDPLRDPVIARAAFNMGFSSLLLNLNTHANKNIFKYPAAAAEILYWRGMSAYAAEDLPAAVEAFGIAFEQGGQSKFAAWSGVRLAQVHAQMGDPLEAAVVYLTVAELLSVVPEASAQAASEYEVAMRRILRAELFVSRPAATTAILLRVDEERQRRFAMSPAPDETSINE